MSWALQRHPESRGGAQFAVAVELSRGPGGLLRLLYSVTGEIAGLRLPPVTEPERTDELWRSTCFEAFIRRPQDGYYEFNFAPSTRWAAYVFESYRAGMAPVEAISAPRIRGHADHGRYELQVELELDRLPDPLTAAWRLALSVVLEDDAGAISYWALTHPAGKPDFHHPDSFTCELLPTDPR